MRVVDDGGAIDLDQIFSNLGVGGGEVNGRGKKTRVESRWFTGCCWLMCGRPSLYQDS